MGLWRTPAWRDAEAATVRAVETAAQQLARADVVVDEIELPAEFELFLDAQSDVLRFEAARVFAFERTRRADLLSPSSREELTAGAAIPRRRYLEAQALIARCRTLFATAIAPFDLLLSASAPGEAPAGLDNTGEAMFNRLVLGTARSVPQSAGLHRAEWIAGRRSVDRRHRRRCCACSARPSGSLHASAMQAGWRGARERTTALARGRHSRDDLVERAVRERAQLFIGPILDRVGHPDYRRLVTECLALGVGGLHEGRRRNDHRRDTAAFEIA